MDFRGNVRKLYYLLPLAGTIFGIWYVCHAFYDVVYSDYIRLVNSYLPDVWDPAKFFVPDILTRIPINYLARIINVTFFHYSITFDQILGVLSLGLSAVVLTAYCNERKVNVLWIAAVMLLVFSLNKWEMLINGSGWVHFLAFAGFYYHYLVLDRVWSGREKKGDKKKLLWLPWFLIICVTGPYCAIYVVIIFLACGLKCLLTWREEKRLNREYVRYALSAAIPFLCYLVSNAFVLEDNPAEVVNVSMLSQLIDTPGYFVRFLIKSFASMVADQEYARMMFSTNEPYIKLGLLVMAAYFLALWYQWRYRIYEETIFPLLLVGAGGLNHLLILMARWGFMAEDYGMSSRYALQFQVGIIGILLTYAMAWRHWWRDAKPFAVTKMAGRCLTCFLAIMFLAGGWNSTRMELLKIPARERTCQSRALVALDFENRTDDELREKFEYRTSIPYSGQEVRKALTILKENDWNVFYGDADIAELEAADTALKEAEALRDAEALRAAEAQ